MPITTKVVSLNPVHGEVFVCEFRQVAVFLRVLRFPPPIKTNWPPRHQRNIVVSGFKHHKSTKPNLTPFTGFTEDFLKAEDFTCH